MMSSFSRRLSAFDRHLSTSLLSTSSLAQASIARDIQDDPDSLADNPDTDPEPGPSRCSVTALQSHPYPDSYRRLSFASAGSRATILPIPFQGYSLPPKYESIQALYGERTLLQEAGAVPPPHSEWQDSQVECPESSLRELSATDGARSDDVVTATGCERALISSESTPLLKNNNIALNSQDDASAVETKWEEPTAAELVHTSWQHEARTITGYSLPLIVTFLLQYSLTMTSIFTVGHIGKVELGAVSLAIMTANISGSAVYQGLATALDTLCAQAYGSGHRKLVGLQTQRMVYFLWIMSVPIGVLWLFAGRLLSLVVPEPETAYLAGLFLKIALIGAPGFAAFEAGKRFVQAQGQFSTPLYVLLVCAPLNILMNWLFVWKFGLGFIGAPIAVAITHNLLPIGLIIHIRFFSPSALSCWGGLNRQALHNWGPMVKLALFGVVMVEAECLAFEILTLASSHFGPTALAAQSVLSTMISLTFQIPFPLSVAGSTRVANFIGATLVDSAKTTTKVVLVGATLAGLVNVTILSSLKEFIPHLFTSDPDVIRLVSETLPLCAAFQLFDALAAACNGILRGIGRQEFGSCVQLLCYYAFALPISFGTAFGLGWEIRGLWTGVALALGIVTITDSIYLYRTDWQRSAQEAQERNQENGV